MNTRNCASSTFFSGTSGCEIDHSKIKSAILVKRGFKLTAAMIASATALLAACHSGNVFVIKTFVEYAKNGGDPNTSAVGYGGEKVNGYSAMQDQFTLEDYSEALAANIASLGNAKFDVYYVDEDNNIFGYDDGTDVLAGFPLNYVSCSATPYSASGSQATLVVNFAHKDTKKALEHANYQHVDFDVVDALVGLMAVDIVKVSATTYKVVEHVGGYDVTPLFGSASTLTNVFVGATSASYANGVVTVSNWSSPKLGEPSALHTAGIDGYKWSGKVVDRTAV